MFSSKLGQQLEQIKERIQTINDSLYEIDYNPDRYIRLDRALTPNTEIREFRSDLRACTDDAVSADDSDQYSEQKFLQVKAHRRALQGQAGPDGGRPPLVAPGDRRPQLVPVLRVRAVAGN